jgi:hypothetical protein
LTYLKFNALDNALKNRLRRVHALSKKVNNIRTKLRSIQIWQRQRHTQCFKEAVSVSSNADELEPIVGADKMPISRVPRVEIAAAKVKLRQSFLDVFHFVLICSLLFIL